MSPVTKEMQAETMMCHMIPITLAQIINKNDADDGRVAGKLVCSNIASGRVFGEAIWKCFLMPYDPMITLHGNASKRMQKPNVHRWHCSII